MSYERIDGPDGDPAFNPYGVPDDDPEDFTYTYYVPRVTSSTNLGFTVCVDGSAVNVLMKLDGGMDLNGVAHAGGDPRDHPPGNEGSTQVYEGYEQMGFNHRQYAEKFAAKQVSSNTISSLGAETYVVKIGTNGFTINPGAGPNDEDGTYTAEWISHAPESTNDTMQDQFWPPPEIATNATIYLWAKVGYELQINRLVLYYTTTGGSDWPEGAGGFGIGNTKTLDFAYAHKQGTADWWTNSIPAMPAGTELRYKIGGFKQQNGDTSAVPYVAWDVPFPINQQNVDLKKSMMGAWSLDSFDAGAAEYRPHNDFGATSTGLVEGFHVARARAYLDRSGKAAIYNTFVQPFYYDAETPLGEIVYPANGETLWNNSYGAVVRTDLTVTKVWYNILDSNPANDDGQTGQAHGNGTNAPGQEAWVEATEVTPYPGIDSEFHAEWRFDYNNVPTSSPAIVRVKLAELSSSTNPLLSDAEGHFTTISNIVTASGPAYTMFVAYPSYDMETIGHPYDMKVWFSSALWNTDAHTMTNRFLIEIDGVAQGRSGYQLFRDGGPPGYHELRYALPDLYNGDVNFLHEIRVTHTNAAGGGVTLTAGRYVYAQETDTGPHVDIVNPPEFDSDGKPFEIFLSPTGDRQFTIRVETDLSARQVWLVFTNSVGFTVPYATISNALAGTVSVTNGVKAVTGHETNLSGTVSVTYSNTTVTGDGTSFTNELDTGHTIRIDANLLVVTQVVSQATLMVDQPYQGATDSNLTAYLQPAFTSELNVGNRISIDGNPLFVQQIGSSSNLTLTTLYPGTTADGLVAYRIDQNPTVSGNRQYWHFLWTNMTEGAFRFTAMVDTNDDVGTVEASAARNTRVVFRQMVEPDPEDYDEDDDGLYDHSSIDWGESVPVDLPESNPESWVNGDVHVWLIYGRTGALLPDTDGDGLSDGLESGWRAPIDTNHTVTTTDTDGDGYPNFRADLDPPFYNTTDNEGLPNYVFYDSRTKLINGNMTDPNNKDTDYDGLSDGIEDRNRNGWTDGDGRALQPQTVDPWTDRPGVGDWPDGVWDASWATHTNRETDPNKPDTDEDGASDGYGEDTNFNGRVDGDVNSNRTWEAGELWLETDPLNPDTDGDGLPDGWEKQYALDPLDDGIAGHTNMRSGAVIATNEHGASGNPDGDFVVSEGSTNAYTNVEEYENGTNPRIANTNAVLPEGAIVVGRGDPIGVLADGTNYQEFMDWTIADCLVLDEYEGGGQNNQGGDVYKGWDGWDESRDIVAFYAHDGGGDGRFYFRLDFYDLQGYAEEGNLDIYVVIDTGNPSTGEMNLPDDVDTITSNRWEAVVAVYQSSKGTVFIDTKRSSENNTTTWGQDLFDSQYGVVGRDQTHEHGFVDAYFNSTLDSVEFSISRPALIDAGWLTTADDLNYQVFTTKDGTQNDPVGDGDIGGRSDVRDAIYNDYIAEDYWQSQEGLESILKYWIPGNSRAGRAKVSFIVHGSQAVKPGSEIHGLVNTGAGAGYYRVLAVHDVFGRPLNLHVTPTLASAIEWARVDPAAGKPWLDGPSLNRRIAELIDTNTVYLLGSTFSDHILPYFTKDFNRSNEETGRRFLEEIYTTQIDLNKAVFWTPERVMDADVCSKILDMGYWYTVLDQNTHLFNWYGRTESLIEGAYRINLIEGVKCFVINDIAASYLFSSHDGGISMAMRQLFNRKARSGTQDQVVTLFTNWEEFTDNDNADSYDTNLRWMANRPWIAVVALEQIAAGEVDAWGDPAGDTWGTVGRGTPGYKQAHNWLNHASQEDYDNWYVGSALEESLEDKFFDIGTGAKVGTNYGMLYSGGIVSSAWRKVLSVADTNLESLAEATVHASVFQTAFHDEDAHDLRRYSTGAYMYPAGSSNELAEFSKHAQAQTRTAAIYQKVDSWQSLADSYTTAQTVAKDADLDGESEYMLFNDRVFAIFERIGGRMVGVWVRDIVEGSVYQALGNQPGYAGSETEREGAYNVEPDGSVVAFRTSGLKDWWGEFSPGVGTIQYVNDLYSFVDLGNGWQITSWDGNVRKTVTLGTTSSVFEVQYELSGDLAGKKLYIRHGLSPDLFNLLLCGQRYLADETVSGGVVALANTGYVSTVSASVGYSDNGHSAVFNPDGRDDNRSIGVTNDTVRMRNQAQTHQVELYGSNTFSFSLGFTANLSDWDGDGIPNTYEDRYGFLNPHDATDGTNDPDKDGVLNTDEYISKTLPDIPTDYLHTKEIMSTGTGVVIVFPARTRREYRIWYENDSLLLPDWSNATPGAITVPVDGDHEWLDNGSTTYPNPFDISNRYYEIRVNLPR